MRKLCLIFCCLLPLGIFAQQYTGLTGLIHLPSADMVYEGQARIGTHFINREMMPNGLQVKGAKYHAPNVYLAISPFSWLEVAYTMTFLKGSKGEGYDPNDIGYYHKDRFFSVKVRLLKEKSWWPSVAIGSNDPLTANSRGSSQYFANYFVAASKHFTVKNHVLGAHLVYRKWESHRNNRWNGLVGGITYQPANLIDLRVIAEYTGDGVNVGFDWKLWKHVMVQASLYDAKYFSGGICLYMNLL